MSQGKIPSSSLRRFRLNRLEAIFLVAIVAEIAVLTPGQVVALGRGADRRF